jgi:hypothetical protein
MLLFHPNSFAQLTCPSESNAAPLPCPLRRPKHVYINSGRGMLGPPAMCCKLPVPCSLVTCVNVRTVIAGMVTGACELSKRMRTTLINHAGPAYCVRCGPGSIFAQYSSSRLSRRCFWSRRTHARARQKSKMSKAIKNMAVMMLVHDGESALVGDLLPVESWLEESSFFSRCPSSF